jgi:hypothetical protein
VLLDVALPSRGQPPGGSYDSSNLWWRHERLHRAALVRDFPKILEGIQQDRDALEMEFRSRVSRVLDGGNSEDRARAVARCWREADEMEDRWLAQMERIVPVIGTPDHAAWIKMNRISGINLPPLAPLIADVGAS